MKPVDGPGKDKINEVTIETSIDGVGAGGKYSPLTGSGGGYSHPTGSGGGGAPDSVTAAMKLYKLSDGTTLPAAAQFRIGDQVYPSGWLATATDDELAALGIVVEVVDDPPPPQLPRLVRKSVIIDRLHDAGKLDAAYAVLQAAPLYDRQRWESREAVYYNDQTLLAVLAAIDADPDVILAPE